MGLAAKKQEGKFTYGDYLSWDDKERWEIIGGEAYNMTPAPNTNHQLVSMELAGQLFQHFKGNPCRVITAPFDVRLPEPGQEERDAPNVVQPDISVICTESRLDRKGCLGPPDLIIEIISPATTAIDKREKFFLYERFGVKEYWLVYPDEKMVEVFVLEASGRYGRPEIYSDKDTVSLSIIKGITVDLNPVFLRIIEKKED